MADIVQVRMEEMLPELADMEEQGVFSASEIKKIAHSRKLFEYECTSHTAGVMQFKKYIKHELAVESLRRKRQARINPKRRSLSTFSVVRRIHSLYTRALTKFHVDKDLWLEYVAFCADSGSVAALSKVLMRALRYHPREGVFWAASIKRQAAIGNIESARKLALKALGTAVHNARQVWEALVEVELKVAVKIAENFATVSLVIERAWSALQEDRIQFALEVLTRTDGVNAAESIRENLIEKLKEAKGELFVEEIFSKDDGFIEDF